jgi:phosphoglycerate dehydrogenase-like enzyme
MRSLCVGVIGVGYLGQHHARLYSGMVARLSQMRFRVHWAAPVVSGQDGLAALDLAHQVLEAIDTFTQRHEPNKSSLALSI